MCTHVCLCVRVCVHVHMFLVRNKILHTSVTTVRLDNAGIGDEELASCVRGMCVPCIVLL